MTGVGSSTPQFQIHSSNHVAQIRLCVTSVTVRSDGRVLDCGGRLAKNPDWGEIVSSRDGRIQLSASDLAPSDCFIIYGIACGPP